MAKSRLLLLVLLSCAWLNGCASYVAPLCDVENRKDLPNFEGHFSTIFSFVTKDGSVTERKEYTISRIDRGSYLMESREGSTRANMCEIDGHFYAEDNKGWDSSFPSKGFVAFQISSNGNGSFDMIALGIDSKVLDAQKIPYTITEVTGVPGEQKTPIFSLLVDNRKVPAEQFVQLLDPMSLKITLQPETDGH